MALADFLTGLGKIVDIADDIDNNAAAALGSAKIRARHETVQCAAVVVLTGYFEAFLKDEAEEFIGKLSAKAVPFASLPQRVRSAHAEDGARLRAVLAGARRNNRSARFSASVDDVAQRLASVFQSASPYKLIWEAFADTKSNPRPDVVADFLKRFGVKDVWKALGSRSSLSTSTLKMQLESLVEMRNECAHTAKPSTIPSTTTLRTYCDFLEKLSTAVSGVISDHLATF
jgi:hypothetical protein